MSAHIEERAPSTKPSQVNEGVHEFNHNTFLQTDGFTKVSNNFLDKWQQCLSKTELLCYLFIARKTTGFAKNSDDISLSQFVKNGCAKNKDTVRNALSKLKELELISITSVSGYPNAYSLLAPIRKGRGVNSYPQKKLPSLANQGEEDSFAFNMLIGQSVFISNTILTIISIIKLDNLVNEVKLTDDDGKLYLADMTNQELADLKGLAK